MIKRKNYIDRLKRFIGKPQIKIIKGIRRSGKSTVLKLLTEELIQKGVNPSQILSVLPIQIWQKLERM